MVLPSLMESPQRQPQFEIGWSVSEQSGCEVDEHILVACCKDPFEAAPEDQAGSEIPQVEAHDAVPQFIPPVIRLRDSLPPTIWIHGIGLERTMQQIRTVSEHIHIVQAVEQVRISTKDDEHVLQDLPNPDLIPESDLQFEKMQPIPLISEVMEDRFTGVFARPRLGSVQLAPGPDRPIS